MEGFPNTVGRVLNGEQVGEEVRDASSPKEGDFPSFEEHMRRVEEATRNMDERYGNTSILQEDDYNSAQGHSEWYSENLGPQISRGALLNGLERASRKSMEHITKKFDRERENLTRMVFAAPDGYMYIANPTGSPAGTLQDGASIWFRETMTDEEMAPYEHMPGLLVSGQEFLDDDTYLEKALNSMGATADALCERKMIINANISSVKDLMDIYSDELFRTETCQEEIIREPGMEFAVDLHKTVKANTEEVIDAFAAVDDAEWQYIRTTEDEKYPFLKKFTHLSQNDVNKLYEECKNEEEKRAISKSLTSVCPRLELRGTSDTLPFYEQLKEQNKIASKVWWNSIKKVVPRSAMGQKIGSKY